MSEQRETTPEGSTGSELEDVRRKKGVRWREFGFDPYGNDTGPLTSIAKYIELYGPRKVEDKEAIPAAIATLDAARKTLTERNERVRIAGRVMLSRQQGKLRFMQLRDGSGEVQLFISKADVGERVWELLDLVDLGDVLLAEGFPMRTKAGELSLQTHSARPLTKALRAPSKFDTTKDVETRYRERYRDLIEHPHEVGDLFRARTLILRALREFYDARDFLEVETPLLHPLRGGATARPFRTHHNTLDLELYLRIAPELYLKRLIVGGFDRVYEVGRAFRNEGISTRHNPEFTILESYQAWATYEDLMVQTEALFRHVNERLLEKYPRFSEGRSFTLTQPFVRVRMLDAVSKAIAKRHPELQSAWDEAVRGGLAAWEPLRNSTARDGQGLSHEERGYLRKVSSAGELLYALYEVLAEKHLPQDFRTEDGAQSIPVFVVDFPLDVSPLARKKDASKQTEQYGNLAIELTDRFELFVEGRELCNAFSELNDPDDQAERFRAQLALQAKGNEEAMDFDADYIRALCHGMPPTAGFGLGFDRFVMALTSAPSIRDVILFPLLRPEATGGTRG